MVSSAFAAIISIVLQLIVDVNGALQSGVLYPRQSETREILSLNGIWNFRVDNSTLTRGLAEEWYRKDIRTNASPNEIHFMPVPSSYNDVTENADLRDHVGTVWYQRTFFVPQHWAKQRVWLRLSSVIYSAQVWINGNVSMAHEIGHLPFQEDVSKYLKFGLENRITVACNNVLSQVTIPQGSVKSVYTDTGVKKVLSYSFDFFHYAGIDRPVTLFTTPVNYIDDINVYSDVNNNATATIYYNISSVSNVPTITQIHLIDSNNAIKAKNKGKKGELNVSNPNLWWPYLMHDSPGYLYTLEVKLYSTSNPQELLDVYRLPVGIRTLKWTNTSLLINGKPVYLHGFGRHEDSDLRGKGLDLVLVTKDYNLIKWVGANAYRTSHYPYADEIMDFADKQGIMIIDECPSVNTEGFSDELLENHKLALSQLINRDKNRPSVIAWSIANEPRTRPEEAGVYFGKVAKHVRGLDLTRPITLSENVPCDADKAGQHLDIISFNSYPGWYENTGELGTIVNSVIDSATKCHKKHNKPVLVSEYGADTIAGMHIEPAAIWTEEYQVDLMSKNFQAFDYLRKEKWFIGEFIWNFADFKTAQTVGRAGGNKKGIFTRQRQPKAAAHHLRRRYLYLGKELHNASLPDDVFPYVISPLRTEL